MAEYTVVYFETVKVERTVEADSPKDAIAKCDAEVAEEGWENFDETTLGCDVIEVLDANGERVWMEGDA